MAIDFDKAMRPNLYELMQNGGGGSSYELPVASEDTLGGVKIGSNMAITDDGILSANNIDSMLTQTFTNTGLRVTWSVIILNKAFYIASGNVPQLKATIGNQVEQIYRSDIISIPYPQYGNSKLENLTAIVTPTKPSYGVWATVNEIDYENAEVKFQIMSGTGRGSNIIYPTYINIIGRLI